MKTKLLLVGILFACIHAVQAQVDTLPSWEAKAYPLIIPAAREVQWQQIPWMTDLEAAVKTARAEKRPLLLWTSGDDPLERC